MAPLYVRKKAAAPAPHGTSYVADPVGRPALRTLQNLSEERRDCEISTAFAGLTNIVRMNNFLPCRVPGTICGEPKHLELKQPRGTFRHLPKTPGIMPPAFWNYARGHAGAQPSRQLTIHACHKYQTAANVDELGMVKAQSNADRVTGNSMLAVWRGILKNKTLD